MAQKGHPSLQFFKVTFYKLTVFQFCTFANMQFVNQDFCKLAVSVTVAISPHRSKEIHYQFINLKWEWCHNNYWYKTNSASWPRCWCSLDDRGCELMSSQYWGYQYYSQLVCVCVCVCVHMYVCGESHGIHFTISPALRFIVWRTAYFQKCKIEKIQLCKNTKLKKIQFCKN